MGEPVKQPDGELNKGGETRRTRVELWVALGAMSLLALACLLVLQPFISAALWAMILCSTTWPLFTALERMLDGRRTLAAAIATLAMVAIIVTPLVILGESLAANIADLVAATNRLTHAPPGPPAWITDIPVIGGRIADYWTLLSESSSARLEELLKLMPAAKELAIKGGSLLAQGIFQIAISLLIVFFLYRDGDTIANRLGATVQRIGGDEGSHVLEVAGSAIRAVVFGILGTALLQGVLAAIGFAIARVPGAVFLGFMVFVVAVVPGGPALVGIPAAYWLYTQNSTGWATFILVWTVIIGSIDNVVRPYFISRGLTMPTLLLILGVMGGAATFGLIGLFLGPTFLAVGYRMFEEWSGPHAPTLARGKKSGG